MKTMIITCKNCKHRKPFFKSGGCDIKGKRAKHPEECSDFVSDPDKWETAGTCDEVVIAKVAAVFVVVNVIAIIIRVAITFI